MYVIPAMAVMLAQLLCAGAVSGIGAPSEDRLATL